ncbi:MAG: hypothetical protein GC184_09125 [Rhizobiales bacterium]|nr:hypothetical protein [Hyphomicrobiales bacterium]
MSGCSKQLASLGMTLPGNPSQTQTDNRLANSDKGDSPAAEEKLPTLLFTGIALERLSTLPNPTQVSDDTLRAVADPLLGKEITVDDLRALATKMEGKFRSAGYPYARVILPPQKVENGIVRFTVVEGWIEETAVVGPTSTQTVQTELRLKHLDKTGPVRLDEIERTVALLQRVPGLSARVSIARGTGGPGAMKLVADAKAKEPKVLLNVQNFGSHSLGRVGATVFAAIPGAAPLGDEFQFAGYNTFDYKEQSSLQAIYQRGLTMDGLTGRIAATYARAKPSGPVAVLGLASQSETFDASLSYPLYLRRRSSLDASFGLAYANFTGELFQGAVPYSDDRTRTLYLGVDAKTKFDGWTVAGGTQLRYGVNLFNGSKTGDSNLARPEGEPDAFYSLANLNISAPSFYGVRLKSRLEGQYSARPLMAVEEYSFGNYTIVRGYDPGAAAGDSAVAMALDASAFHQTFWEERVGAELTGFYDVGRYWNHDSTGTRDRTISSVGGGVRVTFSGLMRADLTYAVPLAAPLGQGESKPVPRLIFSITTDTMTLWDRISEMWGS